MKVNLYKSIKVIEIAKTANMSHFHFIRTFQKFYGVTPRQYLRDLRIEKAKELLRNGLPVTVACLAAGYSSLPTFSTVFRKCVGFSPKEFSRANSAI